MKSAAVVRRPLVPLATAFVFGALLSLPGASGVVDLQRTGQRRTSGPPIPPLADGTVRAGLAWLPERFLDNGDGTSTDQVTGLVWLQDCNLMVSRDPSFDTDGTPGDGYVTWARALEYVAALNADLYLGHADWRLPNALEAETADHLDATTMGNWLEGIDPTTQSDLGQAFTNTGSYYWTSTTLASAPASAWVLSTIPGVLGSFDKAVSEAMVWPVRASSTGPSRLWRTGQSASYGDGDDGELEAGAEWPSPRFTDHADGTVTDNLTGLMWTQDAHGPGPSSCMTDTLLRQLAWYENSENPGLPNVQAYLLCLNAIPYLGHADWRLPNRHEMRSLVDFSRSSPALPAGHPFSNVQLSYYWTASDYFDDSQMFSDWAWYLHFGSGLCGGDNKLTSHHVWPVRDGYVGASSSTLSDPDPVSSTWLFFPDTPTGQTATKVLAVASSGQSPLVVGAIRLDGAAGAVFAVTADTCSGAIVQPGASCTVTLRFAPTAVGTTWDTFHLPSSSDQTWTQQLTVVGAGLFSAQIFADGFEGGSTGSWSNTVG